MSSALPFVLSGVRGAKQESLVRRLQHLICKYQAEGSTKKEQIARFTSASLTSKDPFEIDENKMDQAVIECLEWRKNLSNTEVTALREQQICEIEQLGANMWRSGAVHEWMNNADHFVKCISRNVNGPLLEQLAQKARSKDTE